MSKVLNTNNNPKAGSRRVSEPRLVGDILKDLFENSNEPLAVAYRGRLFKDIHPNTELDVDLKLLTRETGRMEIGAWLDGIITHDGEDHYTFIQNAVEKKADVTQRNPRIYSGMRINGTLRLEDLHIRLNFKEFNFGPDFNVDSFAIEVMTEVREALNKARCLIEEMRITE